MKAAPTTDKLLIVASAVLALGSAAGFGMLALRHSHGPAPLPHVELASTAYTPAAPEAPPVKVETWNPPPAQSRGREWIYDTFTPPEIFYNPRSKQFTVKPPSSLVDEEPQEDFGLELVSVRPEPFRLQLIGFVGGEGNWRGTFENMLSGEVFLGSAGRRVPNLALSIKSFAVTPQPIALPESMTTRQLVATAVVHDDRSGRDITLTHRERLFTGTVFALVAAPGESAAREVRAGDVFKLGDATFRIEKIQLTPAALEVTKEAPTLTQPDHRSLTPRETEAPENPDARGGGS
jgi:hypothetical protein